MPPFPFPELAMWSQTQYRMMAFAGLALLVGGAVIYVSRLNLGLARHDSRGSQLAGVVPEILRRMRIAARVMALLAIIVPVFVLIGWTVRSADMVSIIPGHVAMNPVVAVCAIVCAVLLLVILDGPPIARQIAKIAGLIVAVVALVRLVGFAFGVDTFVDQILFAHRLDLVPNLPPNRMAPNTAISLMLIGLAISLIDITTRRGRRPAELLAIGAGLIALLGLVGYLYSVTSLYHMRAFIPMALHSAIVIMALSLGVLFVHPELGMMSVVTSDTAGGVTARQLLPAAILVPIALGWLREVAIHAKLIDGDFGVTLLILANVFFFVMLIWSTAGLLRRSDSQRRAIESALGRERNVLRSLIDNLPDNIYVKDATGHYILDNIAHAKFVGFPSPKEVVGKTVADFFPPEVAAKFTADDHMVMDSGEPLLAREEPIVDHNGKPKWVATTKVPLRDSRNTVTGMVCISRDITEQVRARQLLSEQNQKLTEMARSEREAHEELKRAQTVMLQTEKLAALGELVAGVAHEINNPLSFVSNNVAVLQRDVKAIRQLLDLYRKVDPILATSETQLLGEIRELSERIDLPYTLANLDELMLRSRDGLKRIQNIVKDLRDFARLDESDLHDCDLNQGIESTVNIVRGRAKSRRVNLELDLHPLPLVSCYPAKINQVVMNLVANAIDACPPEGNVTVRSNPLPERDSVRLEVIDTGSGIKPEILEKIFDPFFTTKPQGEGTGLGLSISYGIVRDHQGTIEVDSTLGKGSRFMVTLPCHAVVRASRSSASGVRDRKVSSDNPPPRTSGPVADADRQSTPST
jgi:two-component system, NtrC family, sensor kinase